MTPPTTLQTVALTASDVLALAHLADLPVSPEAAEVLANALSADLTPVIALRHLEIEPPYGRFLSL